MGSELALQERLRCPGAGQRVPANRRSGPSARQTAHDRDLALIRQIHADSRGTYGHRRVHAELRADGRLINRKRVARLMRMCDLSGAEPSGPPVRTSIGGHE